AAHLRNSGAEPSIQACLRKIGDKFVAAGFQLRQDNAEHVQDWNAAFAITGQVQIHGRLQCRQDELVATQGAKEWLTFKGGDKLGLARNHAGLRTAKQLISAKSDKIHALRERLCRRGFVLKAE